MPGLSSTQRGEIALCCWTVTRAMNSTATAIITTAKRSRFLTVSPFVPTTRTPGRQSGSRRLQRLVASWLHLLGGGESGESGLCQHLSFTDRSTVIARGKGGLQLLG